jgi:hypothetical protein
MITNALRDSIANPAEAMIGLLFMTLEKKQSS